MFTGIIEEVGTVTYAPGKAIHIRASHTMDDTKVGDSIAVDGTCLTVTRLLTDGFAADVSPETLQRTTLGYKRVGDPVNLERALRLQDRLGGHLVLGHVDGIGQIQLLHRERDAIRMRVSAPAELMRYIAMKGSITVDGISLTISDLYEDGFEVALIPHTMRLTTLSTIRTGDAVNLEIDLLSRYVERLISFHETPPIPLDKTFLAEHGFL